MTSYTPVDSNPAGPSKLLKPGVNVVVVASDSA
jgi:hypothetical protein